MRHTYLTRHWAYNMSRSYACYIYTSTQKTIYNIFNTCPQNIMCPVYRKENWPLYFSSWSNIEIWLGFPVGLKPTKLIRHSFIPSHTKRLKDYGPTKHWWTHSPKTKDGISGEHTKQHKPLSQLLATFFGFPLIFGWKKPPGNVSPASQCVTATEILKLLASVKTLKGL